VWCFGRRPCYGLAVISLEQIGPAKTVMMEVKLYVRNLSKATTEHELSMLFAQAGDVTVVDIIKDHIRGESRGFAFVTMSTQNEADRAVSMFNAYLFGNHSLKVDLVKPRQQRGL